MRLNKSIPAILSILSILTFESCKKGEGDPILSLKSRKARVVGEWTIDKLDNSTNSSSSSTYDGSTSSSTSSVTMGIEGTTFVTEESSTYSSSGASYSSTSNGKGSVEATLEFKKDGTFERAMDFKNINFTNTFIYDGNSNVSTNSASYKIVETGTWNFLGGVEEDYKNKERIILNILTEKMTSSYNDQESSGNGDETYTYANGEYTEVMQLTTLKSKEIVMEGTIENSSSGNYTDIWDGTSSISVDSGSESGTTSVTLVKD